ncbi:FecCD family ABC transporter permease [Heyndrickxia sp. FSL W8-0423]|uniref:FecCD family ABC transporter permease n=1 Tax=Heyndrickxia sp. FSL W8-0423 TaxID=2921601 RepID=UPI0030FB6908
MKRKGTIVFGILLLLLIAVFFINLSLGTISISPLSVVATLAGYGTSQDGIVLFDFRLPRIIIALLIGIGLAISGVILQGITNNDLADPGILGINTGAGLFVVIFIFFTENTVIKSFSSYLMPLAAFAGAIIAMFLIYVLAWKNGITPKRLILVGIGINSAFSALLIIFQLKMTNQSFSEVITWLSGDLWGTNWGFVAAILPWIIVLGSFVLIKSRTLNVLRLGDELSVGMGIKLERERRILLFVAAALAGACVAFGGGLAFIGLIAPHLAKRIVGPLHQIMIPVAALIGALILLIGDTIARNFFGPSEIPVGLIVSIIGAPYFVYLLVKTA